jgi:eukaryotic-like serine/threonine-protein kinase
MVRSDMAPRAVPKVDLPSAVPTDTARMPTAVGHESRAGQVSSTLSPSAADTSHLSPLALNTAVPKSSPSSVGTIGKYRLIRPLATGGMAQLFLAASEGPGGFSKQCALKVILPAFATMADFTAMFINEARVSAMLQHPNIVEVYDFGCEDERYFIAMEYVNGCSLEQLMTQAMAARQPLGPRFATTIGMQVCDAMSYVQTLSDAEGMPLNLVHRDLSPDNILLTSSGVAKVSDFGIVKSDINLNATMGGVLKGKAAYMSPEQIRSRPLDARSDIFSLCAVLYEVSTGVSPFKRDSMTGSFEAIVHGELKRPSELVSGFPLELERILVKGLTRDRDFRFSSFLELGEALERFATSQKWTSNTKALAELVSEYFPQTARPRVATHSSIRADEAAGIRTIMKGTDSARASSVSHAHAVARWTSAEVFLLLTAALLAVGIVLTFVL